MFLNRIGIDRRCVVFTGIPNSALNSTEVAEVLATALHTRFLAPKIDGLGTIDGGHLNSRSAELWSAAFLKELTPIINECLGLDGAPRPAARTAGQGDARETAKRNCAHAWCERHDLAPMAKSAGLDPHHTARVLAKA